MDMSEAPELGGTPPGGAWSWHCQADVSSAPTRKESIAAGNDSFKNAAAAHC